MKQSIRGVAMTKEMDDYLKHLKDTRGLNISAYIRIALREKLQREGLAQMGTEDEG